MPAKFLPQYRALLLQLEGACQRYCPLHCGIPSPAGEQCAIDDSDWLYCPTHGSCVAEWWHWSDMLRTIIRDLQNFRHEQEYYWEAVYPAKKQNTDRRRFRSKMR